VNPRWRPVVAALPAVALIAGGWGFYAIWHKYTPALQGASAGLHPSWLIGASVLWLATYIQLILLWAASFPWWGSRIRPFDGLRVFALTNLTRYIPGTVWQFAGLAGMAKAAGASASASSVGVILLQIVTLGTGFAICLSATPRLLGSWAQDMSTNEQLALAAVLVALLVIAMPRMLPVIRRWTERVLKRPLPLPVPPHGPFALYVVRVAVGWVGYGLAFWMLTHALLGDAAPSAWVAVTSYVASYMVGLLAVLAPGGLVVREGALVVLLTPSIGAQQALLVALAARLWQVVLEVMLALAVMAVDAVRRRRALARGA
jgi:uncharacterized membrane protein YbhN (UPF0104 family)